MMAGIRTFPQHYPTVMYTSNKPVFRFRPCDFVCVGTTTITKLPTSTVCTSIRWSGAGLITRRWEDWTMPCATAKTCTGSSRHRFHLATWGEWAISTPVQRLMQPDYAAVWPLPTGRTATVLRLPILPACVPMAGLLPHRGWFVGPMKELLMELFTIREAIFFLPKRYSIRNTVWVW